MDPVKKDIFINGKAKAFELVQMLTAPEKERILNKIQLKNPALAEELKQNSFSIQEVASLGDQDIQKLFPLLPPQIMGMALRNLDYEIQRRILILAPRDYAKKAFEILKVPIDEEGVHQKRAGKKVSEVIQEIIGKKRD